MSIVFQVKESRDRRRVDIVKDENRLAVLRPNGDLTYLLVEKDDSSWSINQKAKGEASPFTIRATKLVPLDSRPTAQVVRVLEIGNGLFTHNGRFYFIGCVPEGRSLRSVLTGKRYICRLDNFPFSRVEDVDRATIHRLRTFRGRMVGEFEGAGPKGHRVTIAEELQEIALPLAASCYLLFSSA